MIAFVSCVKTPRSVVVKMTFNAHHHSFNCLLGAKFVPGARISGDEVDKMLSFSGKVRCQQGDKSSWRHTHKKSGRASPSSAHLSADFLPQYSTKKIRGLGTRDPKKTSKPAHKGTGMWRAVSVSIYHPQDRKQPT